jgi:hypothetical protein
MSDAFRVSDFHHGLECLCNRQGARDQAHILGLPQELKCPIAIWFCEDPKMRPQDYP